MESALKNLGIPLDNKVILSIDGGGMRGILTIQLLKKLEAIAGSPCYEWCDMVAGTSTGAIIASLMLKKKNTKQIEELYMELVSKVFTKRNFFSDRYINPPKFDKVNYKKYLKDIMNDSTLEDACKEVNLDCLLTAKDMAAGEETFFTCFKNKEGSYIGTYKDVLLRAVVEATMSAPTYFSPFDRFVDGGTTTYNNPTLVAVLEALDYTGKERYQSDKLTVFSFGTGTTLRFINPDDIKDPKGPDIKFWLNYVMDETSKDASEMQIDLLRSGLINGLDLRRYQISLDSKAINKIPNKKIKDIHTINANWLHELNDSELSKIDMSDVTKFSLMKIIGESMAEYICPSNEEGLAIEQQKGNWFRGDFITDKATKRGILVSANGDNEYRELIKKQLSDKKWIDKQPTA